MTDFLLSTPSPAEFHTSNIRANPSHYPLYARLLGGSAVAWLQDRWGAGIWYVSMVRVHNLVRDDVYPSLLALTVDRYGVRRVQSRADRYALRRSNTG
jgi:hypothetical protein